jgi:hypothetical protein
MQAIFFIAGEISASEITNSNWLFEPICFYSFVQHLVLIQQVSYRGNNVKSFYHTSSGTPALAELFRSGQKSQPRSQGLSKSVRQCVSR